MKYSILLFSLLAFCCIAKGQNLILNPSFQTPDNRLDCSHWYDFNGKELTDFCDTSSYWYNYRDISFEFDTLSPSGNYIMTIRGQYQCELFAETYITGLKGINIYELTFWMKSFIGIVYIGTGTQDNFIASKNITEVSYEWKEYSMTDTIVSFLTDTITVRFANIAADFCNCKTSIDLIELKVTNITHLNEIEMDEKSVFDKLIFYPNPVSDIINFRMPFHKDAVEEIKIYNTNGEKVMEIQDVSFLNVTHLPAGIYYYEAVMNKSGIEPTQLHISRGKFLKN